MKKLLFPLLCAAALTALLTACAQTVTQDSAPSDGVTLAFSDRGITSSDGSGYEIDGTALAVTEAGTYTLTDACVDGSVSVKKGTTGVTLVLNGLSLTSADTAPICCNRSTEVTIVAADGTVNELADATENNDEAYPENTNAENAVIKCKDGSKVTLCGSGTLNIFSGDISIHSVDDCMNAAKGDLSGYDFSMTISGGTVLAAGGSSGMGGTRSMPPAGESASPERPDGDGKATTPPGK